MDIDRKLYRISKLQQRLQRMVGELVEMIEEDRRSRLPVQVPVVSSTTVPSGPVQDPVVSSTTGDDSDWGLDDEPPFTLTSGRPVRRAANRALHYCPACRTTHLHQ